VYFCWSPQVNARTTSHPFAVSYLIKKFSIRFLLIPRIRTETILWPYRLKEEVGNLTPDTMLTSAEES
jgi:hypothetical protein